jgi:NADPH:quinone reductase-like Zn-dependent oxidoreductase
MQTIYREGYGPAEDLRVVEAPVPLPGKGEVCIRVHATTVNRTDCGVLLGEPYIFRFFVGWPRPRHSATGTDFAGVVHAVGSGVSHLRPGDRVFGFNDHGCGSHAQYMVCAANGNVEAMPPAIGFAEAAASAEGAHYALNMLLHAVPKLRTDVALAQGMAAMRLPEQLDLRGLNVLVNGATGAIGSAAVQLLRHFGSRVVAVCATPHLDTVAGLGAHGVIDYTATSIAHCGETFDMVVDAVGKSDFGTCAPLLKEGGVYLSSELGPGNENLYLPMLTALRGGKRVVFPFPHDIPRTLRLMAQLLAEGSFRPLMDRTCTLEGLPEAFRYVASGQKVGNVVLEP